MKYRINEAEALKIILRGGTLLSDVWKKYQPKTRLSGFDAVLLQDRYGLSIFDITMLAYSHDLSIDFEEYYRLKNVVRKCYQCPA
jgi:alanyl-tRNA synthetase